MFGWNERTSKVLNAKGHSSSFRKTKQPTPELLVSWLEELGGVLAEGGGAQLKSVKNSFNY